MVLEGSPAEEAKLQENDQIVEVGRLGRLCQLGWFGLWIPLAPLGQPFSVDGAMGFPVRVQQ